MEPDETKRRIGQEIKNFLAVNGIDRGHFAEQCRIGKSTVDKLVTGIFSDKTYMKVIENSKFRIRTNYAAKMLGGYSKSSWENYISDYAMIHPAISGDNKIIVTKVKIEWDEMTPGMVLRDTRRNIGMLWIPHERSPTIYIQPADEIGIRFAVSPMIGDGCMRGLLLTVYNALANAYVPVAIPIVLRQLSKYKNPNGEMFGAIGPEHDLFDVYRSDIDAVIVKKFGLFVGVPSKN